MLDHFLKSSNFPSFVGFDRLINQLSKSYLPEKLNSSYPPYNIIKKSDENYEIQLAVAGFKKEDLKVESRNNFVSIFADTKEETAEESSYVIKGLAFRSFNRTFQLAEHMKVDSVKYEDGLLKIFVKAEVPEEQKPKLLEIL